MSITLEIREQIDFSKAIKNPFAKIAKAANENGGELPVDVSNKMMKEAIKEVISTLGSGSASRKGCFT